ncbi:MAG: saccharopine dehydrogenase [Phycisphaerae bacterium]|nr:saccharopine dehydrogenase [Phycisphaerae bacterium]
MHAVVLGSGMVGSVMATDLAADPAFRVTAADARPHALELTAERARRLGVALATAPADLSNPREIRRLVEGADVVLGALASHLGFAALRTVIDAGRPCADISFMPENALELDAHARGKGVTCVVDMGVAPGMSHLLAGLAAHRLSPCESIEIYVGGLPRERRRPFEYKAAFSPADVIEEYTRPARLVEHGRVVTRPALSEPEPLDLPGVGTLEAFNTDGLRSLASTLRVPFMKEKTLRYPGHVDLMRAFRETGLFSKTPIDLNGARVVPLELTSALLFPKWSYQPGEEDLTVMRVTAAGAKGGRLTWDLLDVYDAATRTTSMARTTAFPCTSVARLIADGALRRPGVHPPEHLAMIPGIAERLLADLAARNVRFVESTR